MEPFNFHKQLETYASNPEIDPEEVVIFLGRNIRKFENIDRPLLKKVTRAVGERWPKKLRAYREYITAFSEGNEKEGKIRVGMLHSIKDEKVRIELAYLQLELDPLQLVRDIHEYTISDDQELVNLLMTIIPRCPEAVAYVAHFGIQSEEGRKKVLRLAIEIAPGYVVRSFADFGISDEQERIAFALELAQLESERLPWCIEHFEINDQEALIKIACACFNETASVAEHLDNFGIKDKRVVEALRMRAFVHSVEVIAEPQLKFAPKWLTPVRLFSRMLAPDQVNNVYSGPLEKYLESDFPPGLFHKEFQAIQKIKDVEERDIQAAIMLKMLFILRVQCSDKQLAWISEQGLFASIVNFRRPELRPRLAHQLALLVNDAEAFQNFQAPTKSLNQGSWRWLSRLLEARLSPNSVLTTFSEKLHRKGVFGKTVAINTYIEFLLNLSEQTELTTEEKESVLKRVVHKDEKTMLLNIRSANALLLFGKPRLLLEETAYKESLSTVFRQTFGLEESEGFSERFFATLAEGRQPDALLTWGAKLSTLRDPKVNEAFAMVLRSVAAGTFPEEIYKIDTPQMEALFGSNPELLEKWKTLESAPLAKLAPKREKKKPFDIDSWLREQLIHDKHMNISDFPLLQAYLEDPSQQDALLKQLEADQTPEGELQHAFISLSKAPNLPQALSVVAGFAKKQPNGKLFFKHLIQLKKQLLKPPKKHKPLAVYESDAFDNKLLSGTEVTNSCQNIHDNPEFNQGLLGYILHGWNHVLKIAEGENKPFVSRAYIRLLLNEGKPVLYLDRMYPPTLPPRHQKALLALAKQKAAALKMPLFVYEESPKKKTALVSLGGKAPEYSDGGGGIKDDGAYTVTKAVKVED